METDPLKLRDYLEWIGMSGSTNPLSTQATPRSNYQAVQSDPLGLGPFTATSRSPSSSIKVCLAQTQSISFKIQMASLYKY